MVNQVETEQSARFGLSPWMNNQMDYFMNLSKIAIEERGFAFVCLQSDASYFEIYIESSRPFQDISSCCVQSVHGIVHMQSTGITSFREFRF